MAVVPISRIHMKRFGRKRIVRVAQNQPAGLGIDFSSILSTFGTAAQTAVQTALTPQNVSYLVQRYVTKRTGAPAPIPTTAVKPRPAAGASDFMSQYGTILLVGGLVAFTLFMMKGRRRGR